jgi:glycosyltransferase involved in cell wall biosynthesis
MKKILLVSREWSPKNKTGLGFCSTLHEKIFNDVGFEVVSVSSDNQEKNFNLELKGFFHFLFNSFYFLKKSESIIKHFKPDFVAVESLQTVISEIFIYLAKKNKIKLVIISHGISIFPYNNKVKYIIRSIIWLIYLPFLYFFIRACDVFLSLDPDSNNSRHLDVRLFKKDKNKFLIKYNNSSRFEMYKKDFIISESKRKIILCVGYINHIKNQEDLIKLAEKIRDLEIDIKILYNSFNKTYFNKLNKIIFDKNIKNIYFINENGRDIFNEIVSCWLLINVSITEVSPLSLIEGNSLSKIFFSYNVGSLDNFKGAIVHYSLKQIIFNIRSLYSNSFFLKKLETEALKDYTANYSEENIKNSFKKIQNIIL